MNSTSFTTEPKGPDGT